MILDIKPVGRQGLDCVENELISVANWLGVDFNIALTRGWSGEYRRDGGGNTTFEKFYINSSCIDLLNEFCGISYTTKQDLKGDEVIKYIQDELSSGRPIIIQLDCYWCPWHPFFEKVHTLHYVMIIGYNEDAYMCVDPMFGEEILTLPQSYVVNGSDGCLALIISKPKKIEQETYFTLIIDNLKNMIKTHYFDWINTFADDLEKNIDFQAEMKNFKIHIGRVPLITRITEIGNKRATFLKCMEYVSERFEYATLFKYIQDFEILCSKWTGVRNLIIKSYHTGFSRKKDKIMNQLKDIYEMEKLTAKNLLQHLKTIDISHCASAQELNNEGFQFKEIVPIDISKHFNNIGFSLNKKDNVANFTDTEQFFVYDDILGEQMELRDFWVFSFCKGLPDNVLCDGQQIDVVPDVYVGIKVLGTSEWGNSIDYIKLVFKDGTTMSKLIQLSDWSSKPVYGEEVFWKGKGYDRDNSKTIDVSLFVTELPILANKVLASIVLPKSPNLHIFGLTLFI